MRSRLIPHAVRWYTGEANEDDEDDEDDDEDEYGDDNDDEDDDDDDEVMRCPEHHASAFGHLPQPVLIEHGVHLLQHYISCGILSMT